MPNHIAFIMDGNGRWAKKRNMPREYGHRFGVKAFQRILSHAEKLNVSYLTFYAFSTENWRRPQKEVDSILKLLDQYLSECEKNAEKYRFCIRFLGDKTPFGEKRMKRMCALEARTAAHSRVLQIAFNYGGRDDILHACNRLISSGAREVTAEQFEEALYTHGAPDPDLLIRTGGDYRISNFMLWQIAYAELYFTDTLWPDFRPEDLDAAIADFRLRKRRYGGV